MTSPACTDYSSRQHHESGHRPPPTSPDGDHLQAAQKDGSFTYWTKFRRDGKLIRTNTGTDNKVKAQQFLRAQQNRIDEGIAPTVDAHKVTYVQIRDNLVKDYETYETRNARAPQVAQTISGHKSASVFARYNIISKADRADAIKKLESFHRNGGAA